MLKNLLNKKRQEGFTIVEVMIVLAIAGLIILVVFLAVPALQRNSRNTQRSNDASLVGAGVNECLNNRNGNTSTTAPGCGNTTVISGFYDTSKLRQLTTVALGTDPGTSTTTLNIALNRKCDDSGSALATGAAARQVALLYNVEGSSGAILRCLEV